MAIKTVCQTPEAQFHTQITPKRVKISIDLPFPLKLSLKEVKLLEANLHNVLELVLARYFR